MLGEFALTGLDFFKSFMPKPTKAQSECQILISKLSETPDSAIFAFEEVRETGKFCFNKITGEGSLIGSASRDDDIDQFLKGYSTILERWKETRTLPERELYLGD